MSGRQADIGAFDSPKFVGVPIGTVTRIGPDWFELETSEPLHNGDGLSYLHKREMFGTQGQYCRSGGQGLARVPE